MLRQRLLHKGLGGVLAGTLLLVGASCSQPLTTREKGALTWRFTSEQARVKLQRLYPTIPQN
jgi:hypothetical protein